jgi:hypothetical protein
MVSRGDGVEWADFVNWIMNALIAAEAMNVTRDRADDFPTTGVFVPRTGLDLLNSNSGRS